MSTTLYIEDGKNSIPVAQLGLISGKQQLIIGDAQTDLIIRTLGSVKIQTGNKFYSIPLIPDSSSGTTIDSATSNIVILQLNSDLTALTYPGDGVLVYVVETNILYITSSNSYIPLNKHEDNVITNSTLYLSYDTEQSLTGEQKYQALLNVGYVIDKINDVLNYTTDDVYDKQLVYSLQEQKHYKLINSALPNNLGSWKEIYLNLDSGGVVNAPVTIDTSSIPVSSLAAFSVNGSYNQPNITGVTTPINILNVGAPDFTNGLALWTNSGSSYLQNFLPNSSKGFKFITTIEDGSTTNPLSIASKNVAVNGDIDFLFNFNVTGTSKFTDFSYLNKGIGNDQFATGINGSGYNISYDTTSSNWTLEVDKIITRTLQVYKTLYNSKSVDGSMWLTPGIRVKNATYIDDVNIYTKASKIGNYKDVSGTKVLIPYADKLMYALADEPTNLEISNSPRVVNPFNLTYGVGHMDSSSIDLSYDTYVKDNSSAYVSIPGSYSLVSGAFVPDNSGIYTLSQVLNIYYLLTDSVSLCAIGDLLFYTEYDTSNNPINITVAEIFDVNSTGIYVYLYAGQISTATELVIIGNKTNVYNRIRMDGNASLVDSFEYVSGISSFKDVLENYYIGGDQYEDFPLFTYKTNPDKLKVRFDSGDFILSKQGTSNTVLHGNANGDLSFSSINLLTDISGTLPISNGGTNSTTTLNNNRIIISNSGAIKETAAIAPNLVIVSDANGLPIASSVSTTTNAYNDATSSIQTQLDSKQASLIGTGFVKSTGGTISYDNSTYVTTGNTIVSVASQHLTNQTNITSICSYTNGASDTAFQISGSVNVTTSLSGSVWFTVSYYDENNVPTIQKLMSNQIGVATQDIISIGNYELMPIEIFAKAGSLISLSISSSGSLSFGQFNVTGRILQLP